MGALSTALPDDPSVGPVQGLLPGCVPSTNSHVRAATCNSKPAEKRRNPDSLQAKLHLLVFHHQITDVADRKVTEQLDVVSSDLVEQLGVCVSATQNKAKPDQRGRLTMSPAQYCHSSS